jgi:hypothetical protein
MGDQRIAPAEELRLLSHRLIEEKNPVLQFLAGRPQFVETIAASETLKARARAIRDEVAHALAQALAQTAGRPKGDPDAHLLAGLFLATWTVASSRRMSPLRKAATPIALNERFSPSSTAAALGLRRRWWARCTPRERRPPESQMMRASVGV